MLEDTKSDTRSDTGKAIREINVVRSPSLIISPPFQRHMPPAPAQGAVLFYTKLLHKKTLAYDICKGVYTLDGLSHPRGCGRSRRTDRAVVHAASVAHACAAGERRHSRTRRKRCTRVCRRASGATRSCGACHSARSVGLCRWRGVSALLHPVGGRRLVLGRILRDQHVRAERAALREVEPARVAQRAEQ
ncbi:hypothetical protein GGX14DRAFT_408860 [Mycena pura]|uniref:Uncharacterized protein n=1 Tax=Mycena pura TaxID=153505 RepID=A0AAD6Y0X8_9AGAR|nr:hypothetical protein GGX14DRAFT_408860 [Mycena pura]